MALKMYLDADCTQEFFVHQIFSGTGSRTTFTLTAFTGAQLGGVYKESRSTTSGVTFSSGVGSGFTGLVTNALKGSRVIHNGVFRGTVLSNTATTVTISAASYTQAAGSAAVVSTYARLALTADYSVSRDTLTLVATPTSAQNIIAVPTADLFANFGGAVDTLKTSQTSFWLRRSPITGGGSLNTYDTLQVQALDMSQIQSSMTQTAVAFTAGVGTGFSALVVNGLVGWAVNHAGLFRGLVTANTADTVTISDTSYAGSSDDATIYTVGSLQFAADSGGSPGIFSAVLNPDGISGDTAMRVWVSDTIAVPQTATNYPNNIIAVTGVEYLA